jgi:hypothetical protein
VDRAGEDSGGWALALHGAMIVIIAVLFYKQLYGLRWLATGKSSIFPVIPA